MTNNDRAESSQRNPQEAPFGLPTSFKSWCRFMVVGLVSSLLIMGLVYEMTQSTFLGPLSVAEATGFGFLLVYWFGAIGPLSPFRVRRET